MYRETSTKGPRREVVVSRSAGERAPPQNTPAYRAYKSQLNGMFEGRSKLPAVSPVATVAPPVNPTLALGPKDSLRAAESEDAILSATQACLDEGGIPMDADLIAKALTLKHERYLVPAMEALLDLMERGRPKNAKLLVQRIVQAHDYLVAGHSLDLARGLRMRLGDYSVS